MPHPLRAHGPDPDGGPGRAAVEAEPARPEAAPAARRATSLAAPLAVGLATLAATAYLGLTDPYRPGAHPVCPVLALTGFFCAGCGGQRAVHELAHGDVAAAWGLNPLLVLAAPVALLAWARWVGRRLRGDPPRAVSASPVVPWVLVGVVVAFAVLRNVPALAPWLAP